MKLGHHNGTKVRGVRFLKKILGCHNWGKKPTLGAFLMFLSLALHPVIKIFWNFIYIISSTLFNNLRKLHVHDPYLLNFFFGIFGAFSHDTRRSVIGTFRGMVKSWLYWMFVISSVFMISKRRGTDFKSIYWELVLFGVRITECLLYVGSEANCNWVYVSSDPYGKIQPTR